ncbi:hypothetical protein Pmani_035992 [Petrolisthes manimaculis]|uniref:Uncharacterized protein n=1 Tax=Petrolisthes manimaculis TaxID=1843537 RepID=A0AAE1NKJ1_9EUCA|nr:hypothetical protein Pmani_035992 [Petrolisthes manimaculis]
MAYLPPSGSSCILARPQLSRLCLADGIGGPGRESEADAAQVPLTIIQIQRKATPVCVAKKAAFTNIRSKVQARLRSMQDAWLSAKADEIQEHADNHDVRKFYDALRAVYGPQSSGSSPPA